jgi:m7GpppX diphosphatase
MSSDKTVSIKISVKSCVDLEFKIKPDKSVIIHNTNDHILKTFATERILSSNNDKCQACLLGSLVIDGEKKPAIVILKKNGWEKSLLESLDKDPVSYKLNSQNGKWFNTSYIFNTSSLVNIICPAGDEDIAKYTTSNFMIVSEPYNTYKEITMVHINKSLGENKPDIKWIDAILNGEKEQDRILHNDSKFVFVKGYGWDDTNINEFNGLILIRDTNLFTLRDLNKQHLALLYQIRSMIYSVMNEKYKMSKNELRLFVHYLPTFYRFHIHVITNKITRGYTAGRIHFLDEIISNIELNEDYYQKGTLVYELQEKSPLYQTIFNYQNVVCHESPTLIDMTT